MEGEETAPKRAASHSERSVETVWEGSACPVSRKVVKPAGRVVKVNVRGKEVVRASRTRRPA